MSTYSNCFLKENKPYVCGYNYYGQLGLGTKNNVSTPTLIEGLDGVIQATSEINGNNSYFLLENGDVYAAGKSFSNTPNKIDSLSNIIQISSGSDFSYFLNKDGEVYVFGSNYHGQLGTGNTSNISIPTKLNFDKKIISVYTGFLTAFLLDSDRNAYVCGNNENYLAGTTSTSSAFRSFTKVDTIKNIKQIDVYDTHTLFLTMDGKAYGCGINDKYQLGLRSLTYKQPVNLTINSKIAINIKQVMIINVCSFLLTNNGDVYMTGTGGYTISGSTPVSTEFKKMEGIPKIKRMYSSINGILLLDFDNIFHICGTNSYGELGITEDAKNKFVTLEGFDNFTNNFITLPNLNYTLFQNNEEFVYGNNLKYVINSSSDKDTITEYSYKSLDYLLEDVNENNLENYNIRKYIYND